MSYKNKIISSILVVLMLLSFIIPLTTLAEENNDYLITDELKKLFSEGGVDIGTVKKELSLSSFSTGSSEEDGFFRPSKNPYHYMQASPDDTSISTLKSIYADETKEFSNLLGSAKYKTVAPILYFNMLEEINLLDSNSEGLRELSVLKKSFGNDLSKYLENNTEIKEKIEKNTSNYLNPNINRALFAKIQLMRFMIATAGSTLIKYPKTLEEANSNAFGFLDVYYSGNNPEENFSAPAEYTEGYNLLTTPISKILEKYNSNYTNILEDNLKIKSMSVDVEQNSNDHLIKTVEFGEVLESDRGYLFEEDIKKLAEIPFKTLFPDDKTWNLKESKAIREMLVERLRLIYALIYTVEDMLGVKASDLKRIVANSANEYMELRIAYDNATPEELNTNLTYGLKYPLSLGDTGSLESKEESGETLSKQQKEDISEALDKYPGIWDPVIGFTPGYKGLFAWTSAFTPFKTNIFDGNNRKNLNKEELSLLDSYGANRSVLYVAQGDHGVLRNIEENSNSIDFSMISLAEFIQKASKDEIALFVRHEATKLVMNTDNTIEEITGVSKTSKSDQEAKEIDDNIKIRKEEGKDGEKQESSSDKTPVSDIQEEVGAYKVGEKDTTVFLGPFYTSSGQYGKDLVSLIDASETRYLKGEAWTKDNFFSFITDQLLANGVDQSEITAAVAEMKSKTDIMTTPEEFNEWYHNVWLYGDYLKAKGTLKNAFEKINVSAANYNPENIVNEAKKIKENNIKMWADSTEWDLQRKSGKITGNQANINYVWMYNSLIDGKSVFKQLEEDMQKPLYIDFLGNITTKSGIVVVPAAANSNLYTTPDMIMANAMFLNGYPDIKMNEKDIYEVASNFSKRKYIMTQLNSGGHLRWYKPLTGDKTLGNGDEIFTAPLASEISEVDPFSKDEKDKDTKKFSLIDYTKDFRTASDPLFKNFGALDIDSKVFINNGAVIKRQEGYGTEAINTKKISTSGGYSDWKILKELNQLYINTEKPLHELKLVQLILSSQYQKDQLKNIELPKYTSESYKLKSNKLTSFFGGIFEGINDKLLSKMDKNFLMYTPTQDKLPVFPNSGMYTQRAILLFIIIAFILILIRLGIFIISNQQYRAKPMVVSLVALILIGGFNLYLFNPIINLLFNKPADMLLSEMTPMYVLEMAENSYKDDSPGFFSNNPDNDRINPGDPSLTLERLNRETVKHLRAQGDRTGELSDALYMADLDQTKLPVQGNSLYLQGRELRLDISTLYNNFEIVDVIGFNGMHLDVGVSRGTEANNYMPYLQFLKTITQRINKNSLETYPPMNRINYRKGMSKTTGRAQSYFNSILFVDYHKVEELKDLLAKQYRINVSEMSQYTPDYVRQKIGMNEIDDDILIALKDPTYLPGGKPLVDAKGNIKYTKEQTRFLKKKAEILKTLDILDARFEEVKRLEDIDNEDWLGLRFILGLESNEDVVPDGTQMQVFQARWYPANVRYDDGELINEEKTWERIKRINDDTKSFVIDKISPIAGNVSDDTVIKTVAMYAMMRFNIEFSTPEKQLYPKYINSEGLSNEFVTKASLVPRDEIFISNYNQVSEYMALKSGWFGLAVASLNRIAYVIRMVLRLFLISIIILGLPVISLYLYVIQSKRSYEYLKGMGLNILILSFLYIAEIFVFKINYNLMGKMSSTLSLILDAVFQMTLLWGYIWLTKNALFSFMDFGYGGLISKFGTLLNGSPISEEEYDAVASMIDDDFDEEYYNDFYDRDDYTSDYGYYSGSQYSDDNYGSTTVDLDYIYNQAGQEEFYDEDDVSYGEKGEAKDNQSSEDNHSQRNQEPDLVDLNKPDAEDTKSTIGISGDNEVGDGVEDDKVNDELADLAEEEIKEETPEDLGEVENRNDLINFLEQKAKGEEDDE